MSLTLYYSPGTVALSVHIALHEAGAKFETVRLDFKAGEQNSDRYAAINPKGRVPSLVTDRGILTETPAILLFVAQSFPNANLAPLDDPFALARMQAFHVYLASTLHVAHAHKHRGHRWAEDPAALAEMTRCSSEKTAECFALIENELFDGPWVLGEHYTLADPYLYNVARWIEADGIDSMRFPKIVDHRQRMRARPAVQRALAEQGLD